MIFAVEFHMAAQLDIAEAKLRWDELLARARSGEEILLAEGGKPVVKLVPADENPRARAFGMFEGKVWMSDDFQAPLTDEELKDWGL
jgi:prevent-host-death family protein